MILNDAHIESYQATTILFWASSLEGVVFHFAPAHPARDSTEVDEL